MKTLNHALLDKLHFRKQHTIKIVLCLPFIIIISNAFSQGVSINTTGATANSSAMLDISSTNSGLLIPRMDSVTIAAITNPATSLLVYQTDKDSGFYFYDGTNWTPFLIGRAGTNSGWSTTGNTGTTVGTNFLGTTDAEDFAIYTNNTERMRVDQNGNVGIGTTNPTNILNVSGSTASLLERGHSADGSSSRQVLRLVRTYPSGAGADGIGGHIDFYAETETDGTDEPIGTIRAVTTDATAGTIDSDILLLPFLDGTGSTDAFIVKSSGNVGISTTNPRKTLDVHVNGTTAPTSGGLVGIGITNQDLTANSLSGFSFRAYDDGGTIRHGTSIVSGKSSNWVAGSGNYPGFLSFWTRTSGSGQEERVRIADDGNVGIGTSSPGATLSIVESSTSGILHTFYGSGQPRYFFERANGTISTPTAITNGDRMAAIVARGYDGSAFSAGALIFMEVDGTVTAGNIPGRMMFYTNQEGVGLAERMRINNAGNVGIGNTAPGYLLDVAGTAHVDGLNVNGAYSLPTTDGTNTYVLSTNGSGTVAWTDPSSLAAAGDITNVTAGDGLTGGGASGSVTLNVVARNGLRDNANDIELGGSLDEHTTITQGAFNMIHNLNGTGDFQITDGGATRMIVQDAGNVGIGTASPSELVELSGGGIQINGLFGLGFRGELPYNTTTSLVDGARIYSDDNVFGVANDALVIEKTDFNNTPPDGGIVFANRSSTGTRTITLAITGSGLVGIGTINPTATLCVNGLIQGTVFGACSDKRYKKNVKPLTNTLEAIKNIDGLYYHWRTKAYSDMDFSKERQIGFIAQEVEKYFPEAVMTNTEGYKSIDYGKMTPVLLQAIKEQQEIIEHQTTELKALKAKMDQSEMDQLKAEYEQRLKRLEAMLEIRTEK